MDYPLEFNIELFQTDFIQTEILELTENLEIEKKSCVKTFIIQTILLILTGLVFLSVESFAREAVFIPIGFFIFILLNFLYKFFIGNKSDYKQAVEHLIKSDALGNQFFSPEKGMIVFNKENIEFLTNENRRYFSYDKLKHIKITKRLVVFVLKVSRDKSIRGFHYMILPKRCIDEKNEENIYKLIDDIKKEFNLKEWVECRVLD